MENIQKKQKLSSKKLKHSKKHVFQFLLSRSEIQKRAAEGWKKFLDDPRWCWQWFVSLTFTEEIHPEQAEKYFSRWIRQVNVISFGKHFLKRGRGVTWIRGIECQKRGVIHFHALFSGLPESFNNFLAMKLWEDTGKKCGFSRIYPYRGGACAYMSKYVGKGGDLDIFLSEERKMLDLFRVAMF